ncbi:MAG: Bug family tripartite tricarboxylate transporter substrate binding protein [Burkholderiaceae bacterium]|jgi:tripartite-type tricarboxylate transporter receptor subunit TctC|nr:tripartite tricarboxylate transporter substrate binding protein [Betaproteobacteria bacterium]NBT83917.1 tripartite tricarboxylate transporter substrate binding protein [Betaproteobacteria bacterium]
MKKISTLLYAISLLGVVVFAGPASAQGYPNKTVKVLVGYTPGSSTDIVGRLMAQALTEAWKQSVVVENRGGAAGNLAADAVAKAAPDGYTVLFAQNGLAISTAANPKLPFNGETDLIPVVAVAATPHILVVPMTSPAKSVQDLIAMAKKSKAQLNFGSSGIGNSDHMAAELFKVMAGIDGVHLPYRGGALAATDTISGQLDFYFAGMPVGLPQAQAGRLRALGVTGKSRFPAAPDVPTVAEQGLAGFEHVLWQGFFVPKGTPPDVIKKISDDVMKILSAKSVTDNMASKGIAAFPLASAPFREYYVADIAKWRKVVKSSGIVLQ